MTKTPNCTGTEGTKPVSEHYGRLICTTCGNSVFPTTKGTLRKHVAKEWQGEK